MDEAEYFSNTEKNLRDLYHTARLNRVGGENDFIAGQRNISRQKYCLDLKASVVQTIEEERAENPEGFSETLRDLRQTLELDMGLSPGEYDSGSLFVTAEYDRRPEGSY